MNLSTNKWGYLFEYLRKLFVSNFLEAYFYKCNKRAIRFSIAFPPILMLLCCFTCMIYDNNGKYLSFFLFILPFLELVPLIKYSTNLSYVYTKMIFLALKIIDITKWPQISVIENIITIKYYFNNHVMFSCFKVIT